VGWAFSGFFALERRAQNDGRNKKAKAKYGDAKTKYGDSELLSFAQNDELSSMGALPGISCTPPYPGG